MKVLISNMAWLDKATLGEVNVFQLKKRLTLIPTESGFKKGDEGVQPIELWRETDTMLGVPREFYKKMSTVSHDEDIRVLNKKAIGPTKPLLLREEDQEPLVQSVVRQLTSQPYGGGIVEAWVGFGKTFSAFEIIRRLGLKTLVLVHKAPLMEQWTEEIKRLHPNWKVGKIQGKRADYDGYDIVIGMAQSIMGEAGEKYPEELFYYFGTVVVDEIHRFGSKMFCTVAPQFFPRYMVGLSGTVRRKDGCEDAFFWTIGDIIARADDRFRIKPVVYVRETGFKPVVKQVVDRKTGKPKMFDMNDFQKPTLMGFLLRSDYRNNLIAYDVVKSVKAGRNPLVMGERIEMLERIAELVNAHAQKELGRSLTNGMYFGEASKEDKDRAKGCEVIYATTQIAKEGIDIPRLDTLFMVTPEADPEQQIGRVCRPTIRVIDGRAVVLPREKPPMVVDYLDTNLKALKGIFFSRLKLYRRLGWDVIGLKQ